MPAVIAALDDVAQRHLAVADLPAHVVHRVEHHRRDAGDPEHDGDPGQPRDAALDRAHPAHAGEGAAQDAHAEADDDERDQDRDRDLEHRRLDRRRRARRARRRRRRARGPERRRRRRSGCRTRPSRPAASRPRIRRTTIQAATRQPARIAELGDRAGPRQLGDELVELADVEGADHPTRTRRCAATLRASAPRL